MKATAGYRGGLFIGTLAIIAGMTEEQEHEDIKHLLEETKDLAAENNKMLKAIRRLGMIEMGFRIVWYLILIGLPFALYYYVLDPYFAYFGTSYDQFNEGVQELPGVHALGNILRR